MKTHKMSFTSDQLGTILDALGFAINDNYSMSDPTNAHIQRIIKKIEKELENDKDFDFSPIENGGSIDENG